MISEDFPYNYLRHLHSWTVAEDAIDSLVNNGDLKELTDRKYIVGFLLEQLHKEGLIENGKVPAVDS